MWVHLVTKDVLFYSNFLYLATKCCVNGVWEVSMCMICSRTSPFNLKVLVVWWNYIVFCKYYVNSKNDASHHLCDCGISRKRHPSNIFALKWNLCSINFTFFCCWQTWSRNMENVFKNSLINSTLFKANLQNIQIVIIFEVFNLPKLCATMNATEFVPGFILRNPASKCIGALGPGLNEYAL